MLAGNSTANFYTQRQDLPAELLGALKLPRVTRVVENQRVQVAVASVKYIGYPQAILL